jgi:hypothetical protein
MPRPLRAARRSASASVTMSLGSTRTIRSLGSAERPNNAANASEFMRPGLLGRLPCPRRPDDHADQQLPLVGQRPCRGAPHLRIKYALRIEYLRGLADLHATETHPTALRSSLGHTLPKLPHPCLHRQGVLRGLLIEQPRGLLERFDGFCFDLIRLGALKFFRQPS